MPDNAEINKVLMYLERTEGMTLRSIIQNPRDPAYVNLASLCELIRTRRNEFLTDLGLQANKTDQTKISLTVFEMASVQRYIDQLNLSQRDGAGIQDLKKMTASPDVHAHIDHGGMREEFQSGWLTKPDAQRVVEIIRRESRLHCRNAVASALKPRITREEFVKISIVSASENASHPDLRAVFDLCCRACEVAVFVEKDLKTAWMEAQSSADPELQLLFLSEFLDHAGILDIESKPETVK